MSEGMDDKIQWLVDRALISDLLFSFARALDTRDVDTYINNFTEDGVLELQDPKSDKGEMLVIPRAGMPAQLGRTFEMYRATHHISSNHQITINGDTAASRSYFQAVHIRETPFDHWDAGGWYDCEYRRTEDGWKFTHVKLTAVWILGESPAI
jgi:3-phenylpropionate/cinnamic acid dioxygenase small subunit